jgi:hypothetical protein
MNNAKRMPASTMSDAVLFLTKGAQKRRSLAITKAKLIQGDMGVTPRLVSIK